MRRSLAEGQKKEAPKLMNELSRFRLSEITGERIVNGMLRRLIQVRTNATWHFSSEAKTNRQRLQQFENLYSGKRCFILANGPSLGRMDLRPLHNEITFGMNRVYLLFDQLKFTTNFFVAVNDLVLKQFNNEISDQRMPKFINWDYRHLFSNAESTLFVKMNFALRDRFSETIQKPICSGGTVTFVTLQIAFYMGFQEVILIGLDHNFESKGVPNTTRIREMTEDRDHFHPGYFPKGTKWQLPDLKRSELAYTLAKSAYEKEGKRVLDATVDGKCMVFEKITYSSLFG